VSSILRISESICADTPHLYLSRFAPNYVGRYCARAGNAGKKCHNLKRFAMDLEIWPLQWDRYAK